MRKEVPVFKRCFGCLPLRHGLIVWGYFKLFMSSYILWDVAYFWWYEGLIFTLPKILQIMSGFEYIETVVSIALTIGFIIGCYKKNVKSLRMYYLYTLITILPTLVISLSFLVYYIQEFYENDLLNNMVLQFTLQGLAMMIGDVLMQVYLVLLIRSEFLKLEDGVQFRFVNLAEGECKLQINDTNDTENGQDTGKRSKEEDGDDL